MYKSILLPLDGSQLARQVVPYASLLAKAFNIPVALLEVVPKVESEADYSASQEAFLAMLIARRRGPLEPGAAGPTENPAAEAERRLEEVARPLRRQGLSVQTKLAAGDAATEIIAAAGVDDTLIAMSTHGRTAITRWLLGSVTDKVLRNGRHPVLVIRPGLEQPDAAPSIREVVLPLDGSALSEKALPHAVEIALRLNIPLTVLRSTSPLAYGAVAGDLYPNTLGYSELLEEIRQDIDRYLFKVTGRIERMGVRQVRAIALNLFADQAVLEEMGDDRNKLAVMATHARAGVPRWALGSITDRVIRHGSGPVLVVPPDSPEMYSGEASHTGDHAAHTRGQTASWPNSIDVPRDGCS